MNVPTNSKHENSDLLLHIVTSMRSCGSLRNLTRGMDECAMYTKPISAFCLVQLTSEVLLSSIFIAENVIFTSVSQKHHGLLLRPARHGKESGYKASITSTQLLYIRQKSS